MKSRRILVLIFIFSLLFGIIEILWLLNQIVYDVSLIFTESLNQVALAVGFSSFFIAFLSLHKYFADGQGDVKKETIIGKNVKEIYQYEQLLDPPDVNN